MKQVFSPREGNGPSAADVSLNPASVLTRREFVNKLARCDTNLRRESTDSRRRRRRLEKPRIE